MAAPAQESGSSAAKDILQALIIGTRIECEGSLGTVRYIGPLVHEQDPSTRSQEIWVGVEWDNNTRGKHNGTVKGLLPNSTLLSIMNSYN